MPWGQSQRRSQIGHFAETVLIALLTLLGLALSATIRWRLVASVAVLATFFIGSAMGEMWRQVLHNSWGRLVNLSYLIGLVWRDLFATRDATARGGTPALEQRLRTVRNQRGSGQLRPRGWTPGLLGSANLARATEHADAFFDFAPELLATPGCLGCHVLGSYLGQEPPVPGGFDDVDAGVNQRLVEARTVAVERLDLPAKRRLALLADRDVGSDRIELRPPGVDLGPDVGGGQGVGFGTGRRRRSNQDQRRQRGGESPYRQGLLAPLPDRVKTAVWAKLPSMPHPSLRRDDRGVRRGLSRPDRAARRA